ncbi:hypothetical protein M0R88_13995 [Halorussus gelatinilyticus]|uniref:Uncharacterized protein n=1 Tax=Halorussus gelatinilyticus TaxID=2937524 RepID=A0A8U0IF76_9EURY|nr:hypothetical protein [Halorussus gelatinilyticus]UPV99622.1 hypothetical protein M0R88_13995 [Halorussus gelatinilyticus]
MQDTREPRRPPTDRRRRPTDSRATESDAMNERCTYCDGRIPAEEWHPVATVRDDDGDVEIYAFCSEPCRTSWRSEYADDD